MDEKKINLMWSISLIIISISNIILCIINLFDAEMPDAIAIIFCVVILIAVCMLIYTGLKKWQQKL